MKKFLLTISLVAVTVAGFAQGTINFNNRVTDPNNGQLVVDAPVFNVGGVTKLSGTTFQAMLYAGAQTTDATSLSAVGTSIGFRTGSGAGYFQTGVTYDRTIASVAPGATATLQMRVWDTTTGATWETASIRGASGLINIVTGGAGSPPSLPANMIGLQSFSLVPEPSTIALGVLGMAGLVFIRRRK